MKETSKMQAIIIAKAGFFVKTVNLFSWPLIC
jgi:hypothetical protein